MELSVHIYIRIQIWSFVDTPYMNLSRFLTKLRLINAEYYRLHVENEINKAYKKSRLTSNAQCFVSVLVTSCSPLVMRRRTTGHQIYSNNLEVSHVACILFRKYIYVLYYSQNSLSKFRLVQLLLAVLNLSIYIGQPIKL